MNKKQAAFIMAIIYFIVMFLEFQFLHTLNLMGGLLVVYVMVIIWALGYALRLAYKRLGEI